MNRFDIKCYEQTYNDPHYWDDLGDESLGDRQKSWTDCRETTNYFYDELVRRGYLVPRKS